MTRIFRSLIITSTLMISANSIAQLTYVPGDVLVMLKARATAKTIADDLQLIDGKPTHLQVISEVSAPMRTWLLHYDNAEIPQERMLRAMRAHPGVAIAQSNHITHDRAIPNDTQYGQQWQHQNIHSEGAWDITTGGVTATGDTIVVCIVENADLPHPDLIGNAWYNFHEIPNNGIDDDGNGYIDDFRGWDITSLTDNAYGGSHGTEVAGMIGAKGNNGSQVAGANWNVKLMVVKRSSITESSVIQAYTYPLVMRRAYNSSGGVQGAFVVATNASWGIDNANPADYPLWCAVYDTLGTAGVLNCGATANNAVDIDVVGDMPTGCSSDFMISVTATDISDNRTFSAWGLTTIDVGAPGANIFTTQIGGGTGSASGTSFASPLTAGVIGLLYSVPCASMMSLVHNDPAAGALYVRQALFSGVEQVGNLPGNTVTGGRINANNSAHYILDNCGSCAMPSGLHVDDPSLGLSVLGWNSTGSTAYNLIWRPVGSNVWTEVPGINNVVYTLNGLDTCTAYEFQVQAICDSDSSAFGASFTWTSDGCSLGIATNIATATAVYPNPADKHLIIALPSAIGANIMIDVIDNTGQSVMRSSAIDQHVALNVSSFVEGLYFYRVLREGELITQGEFEVQH